jgi:hypothetical protein
MTPGSIGLRPRRVPREDHRIACALVHEALESGMLDVEPRESDDIVRAAAVSIISVDHLVGS